VSPRCHYYDENHLHHVTANVYRRARIFDSDRFRLKSTQTLADLRTELGFRMIGWVWTSPYEVCSNREKHVVRVPD
jgi:hypothetical protein